MSEAWMAAVLAALAEIVVLTLFGATMAVWIAIWVTA